MGIGSFLGGIGSALSGVASLGGLFGDKGLSPRMQAATEAAYNREVMQNQIQWKVDDARKAGVHPLAALGTNTVSWSPSMSGGGGGDTAIQRISEAGQGIGRAASAFADSRMKKILFEQEVRMNELKIKDAEVSLQKNASANALATAPGSPPALNGADISFIPSQNTRTRRDDAATEANFPAPATKEFINRDGSVTVWPSNDAKQAIEDSMYEWEHMYRNRFAPFFRDQGRSVRRAWDNVWWNPNRGRR